VISNLRLIKILGGAVSEIKANEINLLLEHYEVQLSTASESEESRFRKGYNLPKCKVFKSKCTKLITADQYRFDIDPEARRQLPAIIGNRVEIITTADEEENESGIKYKKTRNIGIVFSGGPAPGGHNVIAGIFDAAKEANPLNRIFGFLVGPDGVIEGEYIELNKELIDSYRNHGGFTMIKTGRTKIDTPKKMALSKETILGMGLDALVVVGGDDSNTNAAFLAQELFNDKVQVIGVPKTIDGDIQVRDADGNVLCAMSFGFHSAAMSFSQAISNLSTDCSSDIKYWHVCKVMGRVASHLALEVALQTHANLTLIGEDLSNYIDLQRLEKGRADGGIDYTAYGMTLRKLSRVICDGIVRRAAVGKNYGIIVIPEGILEFINEIEVFIIKLNTIIAEYNSTHDKDFHNTYPLLADKLDYLHHLVRDTPAGLAHNVWNARDDELFNDLPSFFQEGLLTERDSHGNFQFSQMPTEEVILGLVKDYLKILKDQGKYKIGIQKQYLKKTLIKAKLDPLYYGPIIFKNYNTDELLLIKDNIISLRTLKSALIQAGALDSEDKIPASLEKIFLASVPKFKTQSHFYGYDGRGSDPTRFDCIYTYNLGLTVFSLIANGATGQMATIKNLEHNFEDWEPMGVPIAPLMRLEERKGRLTLVLEKSLVDINSPAFKVVEALREKWLAASPGDDTFRKPGPVQLYNSSGDDRPITLRLNSIDSKK
jgi:pyrophosphate--fructose-6-phosphate 1-phosphotransferase